MPPTFTPAIQQTKKYKEAHNLLALRKSASIALVSLNAKCNRTKSMKDLVHLSRNRLCLQEKIIECELHFCGLLHTLSQDDINHILFVLFDCDESGYVSIAELAEGLRRLHQVSAIHEVMDVAEEIFERFDDKHDGKLWRVELGHFLESLRESMDCSLAEISELLVRQIAFSQNGEQVLHDLVSNLMQGSNGAIDDFHDAITEVRMILLFDMLAQGETCVVPFQLAVKHLLSSGLIDKIPREILIKLDRSSRRVMDYPEFADLVIDLTEHLSELHPNEVELHDVANDFTLSVLCTDSDANFEAIFSQEGVFERAKEISVMEMTEDELEFGRMGRLFTLFDIDHDGTIGPHELVLGMRKIQIRKPVDEIISESINALFCFDKDGDQVLDRWEFGKLFSALAKSNGVDLDAMLGYMLVRSVLQDSSNSEKEYIAAVLVGDGSFEGASRKKEQRGFLPSLARIINVESSKVFASMCA